MRALILMAAALAAGCDDPAVEAKVADILEHGIVAAEVTCSCNYGQNNANSVAYRAQKLIDGSCFVSRSTATAAYLLARSDNGAEACRVGDYSASGGDLVVDHDYDPSAPYFIDLETCCTGFNLEAFGVTP